MICASLEMKDIGNCACCSKLWHSLFGPYRFESVQLVHNDRARTSFLLRNSHHVRELLLDLTGTKGFNIFNYTRLRRLKVVLPLDVQAPPRRLGSAASLIRRNQGLKEFDFSGRGFSRSPPKSIMDAIANHSFLKRIKLSGEVSCLTLVRILHHLPRHIQEFDIGAVINSPDHGGCESQMRLFDSHAPELDLRHLILRGYMVCFTNRMLIPVLRKCPNLENLTLSSMGRFDAGRGYIELALALDSYCKRLHTLGLDICDNANWDVEKLIVLIPKFSQGFQRLNLSSNHHLVDLARPKARLVLDALINSPTVNTIEVLSICWAHQDQCLRILEQCPRLRELRLMSRRGPWLPASVDILDLVESITSGDWKCRRTLEVLELDVSNGSIANGPTSSQQKRRRTARCIRRLFYRLRSLPKLAILDLQWVLKTTIPLRMLNREVVRRRGHRLMSLEDKKWMGLP